mmetsp:Transcript_13703/g.38915  ORF Transcript_13703/g.38915 Transcript_13703/m.38915 type:complete len:244 (+) Transcript_13703:661-1392(+)
MSLKSASAETCIVASFVRGWNHSLLSGEDIISWSSRTLTLTSESLITPKGVTPPGLSPRVSSMTSGLAWRSSSLYPRDFETSLRLTFASSGTEMSHRHESLSTPLRGFLALRKRFLHTKPPFSLSSAGMSAMLLAAGWVTTSGSASPPTWTSAALTAAILASLEASAGTGAPKRKVSAAGGASTFSASAAPAPPALASFSSWRWVFFFLKLAFRSLARSALTRTYAELAKQSTMPPARFSARQ